MADVNLRLRLRCLGNSLVGLLPTPLLRMFLKTFETRPEWAEAAGFHVHPRRFDSPLTLMAELDAGKLASARPLPGIELRIAPALELVATLAPFAREMDSIP